jgi:hypothetical protein
MIQTKTIAMILLLAIATIGAIAVGIGTATQSVKGLCILPEGQRGCDDVGHGQSSQDINGDIHSHGHA